MTQNSGNAKCKNTAKDPAIAGKTAVIQSIKLLGKGYFLITLIGILSFTLLFFILWFM